jgi:hypothetical protein
MNRRTADHIRLLSRELLEEKDEKRILELAAELRAELKKHLKQLRNRLALSEIRERRLKNGASYDFDELMNSSAHDSAGSSEEKSNNDSSAAADPSVPPVGPAVAVPAGPDVQAHVQAKQVQANHVQAKEGDAPEGGNGNSAVKAN